MGYNDEKRGAIRMPWGKYRGTLLRDVPTSYLGWCIDEGNPDAALARAICAELARRIRLTLPAEPHRALPDESTRDAAQELISAGYRTLAKRSHHDAGGDHETMVAIAVAREWLERAIAEAA